MRKPQIPTPSIPRPIQGRGGGRTRGQKASHREQTETETVSVAGEGRKRKPNPETDKSLGPGFGGHFGGVPCSLHFYLSSCPAVAPGPALAPGPAPALAPTHRDPLYSRSLSCRPQFRALVSIFIGKKKPLCLVLFSKIFDKCKQSSLCCHGSSQCTKKNDLK